MKLKIGIGLFFFFLMIASGRTDDRVGGLVLSFDDGYPSWIQTIAPELEKVGGKATFFVNNQRIQQRYLSFDDLRTLQNRYGFEIGTHTYHHFNAVEFAKRKGLEAWEAEELDRSTKELKSQGLKVRSLVFPFNAYDQTISERVKDKFSGFRRSGEGFPLAEGKRADGSFPGKDIDLAGYVPLELIYQWIDFAQAQKKFLFLYGHDVLPDESFFEGRVAMVSPDILTSAEEIFLPNKEGVCLVPDKDKMAIGHPLRISQITLNEIKVTSSDLTRLTKPGAVFILGPCYGTPVSYFKKLIAYSAARFRFMTIEEALGGNLSFLNQKQ